MEETAAENSRLEHEMMMLRQKIQLNMERNIYRDSGSTSEARHIESEMIRVQTLLEDLQRRRVDLSSQVNYNNIFFDKLYFPLDVYIKPTFLKNIFNHI